MARELDTMVESLLADDVIVGISRTARALELEPHQQRAFDRADAILKHLAGRGEGNVQVREDSQLRELVDVGSHAKEIARSISGSVEETKFFEHLSDGMAYVQAGQAREHIDDVRELLTFFRLLGQSTQARAATEIATASQPAWMLSRPTGVF